MGSRLKKQVVIINDVIDGAAWLASNGLANASVWLVRVTTQGKFGGFLTLVHPISSDACRQPKTNFCIKLDSGDRWNVGFLKQPAEMRSRRSMHSVMQNIGPT